MAAVVDDAVVVARGFAGRPERAPSRDLLRGIRRTRRRPEGRAGVGATARSGDALGQGSLHAGTTASRAPRDDAGGCRSGARGATPL